MSKDLELRIAHLEKQLISTQAALLRQRSQGMALSKLLEEVGNKTGVVTFWSRRFVPAFDVLAKEAEEKLLLELEKDDKVLAAILRRELAGLGKR